MAKNDVVMMQIEDIVIDESFNSRVDYDGSSEDGGTIETLARDIKRRGLLQPPVVRTDPDTKKVHLVAGFRRMRALAVLGEKVVPVSHMGELDEQNALLANITENVQRLTLKPAELAIALHRLSEGDMSGAAIASQVGLSKAHVNNLIRIRKTACSYIWGKWSSGNLTTPEVLAAIAGGTSENDQRYALEKYLGARKGGESDGGDGGSESSTDGSGDGDDEKKKDKPKDNRPKRTELEAFEQAAREILAGRLDFPKNKGLTEDTLVTIRDTLAWVNGTRKKAPFTMPTPPKVEVPDEE